MLALVAALGFGFVLGMRHALEPDHIAAVSTLVAERPSWRRGALLGAFWGVGHSVALVGLGGSLLVLRTRLPSVIAEGFELVVALVLIVLGVRSIRRAIVPSAGRPRVHRHRRHEHAHPADVAHLHVGAFTLARRPLVVGLAHGLAGSGALTAIAVAAMPTRAGGFAYVLLFGVGSIIGMAALTGLAG